MSKRANQQPFEVIVHDGHTSYNTVLLHSGTEAPGAGVAILDTGSAFTLARYEKFKNLFDRGKKVAGPAPIAGISGKSITTDGYEMLVTVSMLRGGRYCDLSLKTTVWGHPKLLEGSKADVLLGCDFLAHGTLAFIGSECKPHHKVRFVPHRGHGWLLNGAPLP